MSPQKDPLSPENPSALRAPKDDFPHQKSFWALVVILLLSGFMLFSQHYLTHAPTGTETTKTPAPAQLSKIDKSISLPILSQNEIEAALASPKTPSAIKEALIAASHNKRLRLVKMPLQTDSTAPLPIEVTTSNITQPLVLGPEVQSVLLPIDRTGLVTIRSTTVQTIPRTAIAFDNFGPFPLQFQPLKNAQITLLVISQ